jgi:hypothetical protein
MRITNSGKTRRLPLRPARRIQARPRHRQGENLGHLQLRARRTARYPRPGAPHRQHQVHPSCVIRHGARGPQDYEFLGSRRSARVASRSAVEKARYRYSACVPRQRTSVQNARRTHALAMVAQRIVAPGSKRSIERWLEKDVLTRGSERWMSIGSTRPWTCSSIERGGPTRALYSRDEEAGSRRRYPFLGHHEHLLRDRGRG